LLSLVHACPAEQLKLYRNGSSYEHEINDLRRQPLKNGSVRRDSPGRSNRCTDAVRPFASARVLRRFTAIRLDKITRTALGWLLSAIKTNESDVTAMKRTSIGKDMCQITAPQQIRFFRTWRHFSQHSPCVPHPLGAPWRAIGNLKEGTGYGGRGMPPDPAIPELSSIRHLDCGRVGNALNFASGGKGYGPHPAPAASPIYIRTA